MDQKKKPNFYCIGAQKAGTTSIHEILKLHPDIYLPEAKEAEFFHDDQLYHKGIDWYLKSHFPTVNGEKIIGSVTPNYLYFEQSAKRIFDTFGKDIKFLVILRNPADRAFSHYKMSKFRGFDKLTFEEAINVEKDRISESQESKSRFSYIDRGFYYKQISRYMKYFSNENFLFINFETELVKDIDQTIHRICNFLGINDENLNTNIHARTGKDALFPIINQLLVNNNLFKQKISNVLPSYIKKSIRNLIMKINKKNSQQHKLSDEHKKHLIRKFYFKDIKKLEKEFDFKHHWLD